MKISIDFDDLEIDAKGEYLRSKVFKYHHKPLPESGGKWTGFGCYSTFEVNDDFVEVDLKKKYPKIYRSQYYWLDKEDYWTVHSYENKEILVSWHWDGDGDLIIFVKGDNKYYRNGDCKCACGWEEGEF